MRICPLMQGSVPGLGTIIRSHTLWGNSAHVPKLEKSSHCNKKPMYAMKTHCSQIYIYIWTFQVCSRKESACQCRRRELDPWVGKIPWGRKWQPTPMDRGAWIKCLTAENAYLLTSFGVVISLRVSGCLK